MTKFIPKSSIFKNHNPSTLKIHISANIGIYWCMLYILVQIGRSTFTYWVPVSEVWHKLYDWRPTSGGQELHLSTHHYLSSPSCFPRKSFVHFPVWCWRRCCEGVLVWVEERDIRKATESRYTANYTLGNTKDTPKPLRLSCIIWTIFI